MEMRDIHQACEPREESKLYKIGMFAAMNRVTIKALRFYEEIGLLIPEYINDENGYRYYSLSQMPQLSKITALKQAGFTLEEIKLLNSGADEKDVLNRKKSEILNQIAELTNQLAVIDRYLLKGKSVIDSPVLIREIDEVPVAYMGQRIKSYDCLFDLMPAMGELMERAECNCRIPEYCFTNYVEPGYKDEDIMVEICEAVTCIKDNLENLQFKTMPKIKAACAFHKGSYATLNETYENILKFIEENGYEIDGPIRESYIDGVWNKENESEWLTEVQIPVWSLK